MIEKTYVVYGDRGYDSRRNFEYLNDRGINAVILARNNATTRSRGSPAREKVVVEIKKKGVEMWKEEVDYGKKWKVEIFFSALKRTLGEIMARKIVYQIQEAVMKLHIFSSKKEYCGDVN